MFTLVLLVLADWPDAANGQEAQSATTNPTAASARTAALLAARHGAAFAVLAVRRPLDMDEGHALRLPDESVQSVRRAEVEALLREAMPAGLTADVMHAAGFVQVETLKAARLLGPDIIVLGDMDGSARCRRELSDAHAATATLIAAAALCPVLFVPAGAGSTDGPFERAMLALDIADDPSQCRALLDFAARLAAREGASLGVFHALPDMRDGDMARHVEAARQRLASLCHGLPGADRFRLAAAELTAEGSTGIDILQHATETDAELMVFGVGPDGGGAVLASVLAGAGRPVLLVGPATLSAARRPPQKYTTPHP
jgi:nucleotide-binding universal stress UspA family protein